MTHTGVVSIVTVGLQVSYGIPILCKMTLGRKDFCPGPFSLGRHSLLCNGLAIFWIVATMVSGVFSSQGPLELHVSSCKKGLESHIGPSAFLHVRTIA